LFILGDLNADFNTSNGRKLTQICQLENLECLVHEPTRVTNSTATVLDQIVTNSSNYVKNISVTPPISTNDHCTVGVCLNFKVKKEPAYQRLVWNYKQADFQEFRNALSDADFEECLSSGDVDEACTKWTNLFLNTAKLHVPNRLVTVRPNDSPWYTNELRTMKKRMMRSFHKYKCTKLPTDWEKYTKSRNEHQNGLDTAEIKYKKSLTDSLSSNKNSKTLWLTVKWLLG